MNCIRKIIKFLQNTCLAFHLNTSKYMSFILIVEMTLLYSAKVSRVKQMYTQTLTSKSLMNVRVTCSLMLNNNILNFDR